MEGSAEDLGAPDSWESADLDERMSRLMIFSKKSSDSFLSQSSLPQDFADDTSASYSVSAGTSATMAAASSTSGERLGAVSEDAVNQVDQFLREALEKPRERLSILRMEQDIIKFIRDPTEQQLEFLDLPTSYLRLAAHRVAQHYYLQSVAMPDSILPDGSGSRIVIRRTPYCQLPPVRLADIPVSLQQEDTSNFLKVAIKQRPQKNSKTGNGTNAHSSNIDAMKTVEERKDEYNKARARIFSNNIDCGTTIRTEVEPALQDMLHNSPFAPSKSDEALIGHGCEANPKRSISSSSFAGNRLSRTKQEKEPVGRQKPTNRVAIFRDREVDLKDPDYDRSYDRYMQRFDPGFGFSGGSYAVQPMYTPAINYNTEFPQLGMGHRPQLSIEHQLRPLPQQLHGPWPPASTSSAVSYGTPEGLMPSPYNPNNVGAHPPSSIYLHSQFSVTARPMPFLHAHEHVQLYPQSQQQQPEANFGLARPR